MKGRKYNMVKNETIERKKFKSDDEIEVANYTTGRCIYINPHTYAEWNWNGFGDSQPIPFGELVVMKANFPKFLTDPVLVILNEDVVKHFGLVENYKKIIIPSDLKKFYEMEDEKIVEFLKTATTQTKRLIITLTRQKIEKRELESLFKIKLIEETLNADKTLGIEVDFFDV